LATGGCVAWPDCPLPCFAPEAESLGFVTTGSCVVGAGPLADTFVSLLGGGTRSVRCPSPVTPDLPRRGLSVAITGVINDCDIIAITVILPVILLFFISLFVSIMRTTPIKGKQLHTYNCTTPSLSAQLFRQKIFVLLWYIIEIDAKCRNTTLFSEQEFLIRAPNKNIHVDRRKAQRRDYVVI
jgi:hypothetical protein